MFKVVKHTLAWIFTPPAATQNDELLLIFNILKVTSFTPRGHPKQSERFKLVNKAYLNKNSSLTVDYIMKIQV